MSLIYFKLLYSVLFLFSFLLNLMNTMNTFFFDRCEVFDLFILNGSY